MAYVDDFTQADWEWLRRVLGPERADNPEHSDWARCAVLLRDNGMPDADVLYWTAIVDAHPDWPDDPRAVVPFRLLEFLQLGVTPEEGADWLWEPTPARFVPLLTRAGRTPADYHAYLAASWDNRDRLPREGDKSPPGLFLARWLLCTNVPVEEALAYALAGILPPEAIETWDPIRQSDPDRWVTTLRFMAGLLAEADPNPPPT